MAAEKQVCMIIGASPVKDRRIFREYDPADCFVICADGGYETALKYNITPDLVVGDFDSSEKKPPETVKVLTLPVEKDITDTMYAAMRGVHRGFRQFVFIGCLGGERLDHTIANFDVLEYLLEHGARGSLVDEHTSVFLIRGGRIRMTDVVGATVSVFPYRGATCTVSYSGLKYPLDRETLACGGDVMGVSNSVIKDVAEIRVHTGTALIIVYK